MSFSLLLSHASPPLLSHPLSHKPPSFAHPPPPYLASCHFGHYQNPIVPNSCLCAHHGNPHPLHQAHTFTSLVRRPLVSMRTHSVPPSTEQTLVPDSYVGHNVNRKLPLGLDAHHLPKHVAIVMDGNARWAQDMGLPRHEGHYEGLETLIKIIWHSCDYGILAFTAFIFSTENWHRSKAEVSSLMQLFENMFLRHLDGFMRYGVQVKVIGDLERLPRSLQNTILVVQKRTSQNKGLKLSFAINYGGRLDIIRSCQAIAQKVQQGDLKVEDISEESIDNELSTNWLGNYKNPDLLIRTSGEHRISNYLLWQLAYTELIFLDTYWPALNEDLYVEALLSFQDRDRRYGTRKSSRIETL